MGAAEPPRFESFAFDPAYAVELDPEFPGDGAWGCPTFGFDGDGRIIEPFRSAWGTPLLAHIEGPAVRRWVGTFATGGLGGVRGAFACPSPTMLCVVVDGEAYLVDARAPEVGALVAHGQVGQVLPVEVDLLLLVGPVDIVAVGKMGIAWRSDRIAIDDLRVVEATAEGIVCTADVLDGTPRSILDPLSGSVAYGPSLGSPWN